MSKNQEIVTTIYNSRQNVLEIMEYNGFNIDRYKGFSINEIAAMIKQLDMLLENKDGHKVYIRYFLDTLNAPQIGAMAEELFEVTNTLVPATDVLYIISKSRPTDAIFKEVKNIWNTRKILVVVEHIQQLQFNILKHSLAFTPTILSQPEVDELNKKYAYNKLASISRFDPIARAICLRPGQVVKFMRPSETAILAPFYRRCVEL